MLTIKWTLGLRVLLLAIVLLFAVDVEARRRRRRRTRTRKVSCTSATLYNVKIKKIKKGTKEKLDDVADDDDAAMNCMTACARNNSKWQYFILNLPEENKGEDVGCSCAVGKLKKVQGGNYRVNTGGITNVDSEFLLSKSKKHKSPNDKVCSTATPNPTPSPTPSPTGTPTDGPTLSPTLTPTPSPTPAPTEEPVSYKLLFKIKTNTGADGNTLWSGRVGADEGNVREDEVGRMNVLTYDEYRVSVVDGGKEAAYFTFANAGNFNGWFSKDNLVDTSYTDLMDGEPNMFTIDGGTATNYAQRNWDGIHETGEYSEEGKGGEDKVDRRPMVGMWCGGGHCDNKKNRYATSLGNIVNLDVQHKIIDDLSEEDGRNDARCGDKGLVSKIQCHGDNCDNMRVWCSPLIEGWRVVHTDVAYSGWFSDGWHSPKDCGRDRYVGGIRCRGSWCDDLELVCVKIQELQKTGGRDWYISKNHGGCDVDAGWLTVDSVNDSNNYDPCDWEKNSAKTEVQYAQGNVAKKNSEHKVAEALEVYGATYGEWTMVYKMGTLGGQFNLMDSWKSGGSTNVANPQAADPMDPHHVYRHPLLTSFMRKSRGSGRVKIDLYGKGDYVVGIARALGCPRGSYPIYENMAECQKAAKALNVGQNTQRKDGWEGESPDVPPYCSFQSGGDQAVHFNKKLDGKNDGAYTPICRTNVLVKSITFLVNPGQAANNVWMQVSNVMETSWAGIKPGMTTNFFGVEGDKDIDRSFFINRNYDGCEVDSGWLVVQSKTRQGPCKWEAEGGAPFIMYSPGDDNVRYETADIRQAESFAVSVSFDMQLGYQRIWKGCVSGANLQKHANKTIKQCAEICNADDDCDAFEYGVPYGGGGSYKAFDCQPQSLNPYVPAGAAARGFRLYREEKTFAEAEAFCKSKGSNLASVASRADYDKIVEFWRSAPAPIWIGLNDREKEGEWKYTDGTEWNKDNVTFGDGEPNNSGGDEDCIGTTANDYKLNDWNCNEKFAFICNDPAESFWLMNQQTQDCLHTQGGNPAHNGAQLVWWESCSAEKNAMEEVDTGDKDGSFYIRNPLTGHCLHTKDGRAENNGLMVWWEGCGDEKNKFMWVPTGDGISMYLMNKQTGRCVHVQADRADNDVKVVYHDGCSGDKNKYIKVYHDGVRCDGGHHNLDLYIPIEEED